jgi:hypothetical protein
VEILGIQYRDPVESIQEMAESMIASGLVVDKRNKKK